MNLDRFWMGLSLDCDGAWTTRRVSRWLKVDAI